MPKTAQGGTRSATRPSHNLPTQSLTSAPEAPAAAAPAAAPGGGPSCARPPRCRRPPSSPPPLGPLCGSLAPPAARPAVGQAGGSITGTCCGSPKHYRSTAELQSSPGQAPSVVRPHRRADADAAASNRQGKQLTRKMPRLGTPTTSASPTGLLTPTEPAAARDTKVACIRQQAAEGRHGVRHVVGAGRSSSSGGRAADATSSACVICSPGMPGCWRGRRACRGQPCGPRGVPA